jgi:hypothetical protein
MGNHSRSRAALTPLAVGAAAVTAADTAHATTFNEAADFGDLFADRTLLPIGTDVVNGNVFPFEGDPADVVTFQGLLPGGSFDLDVTISSGSGDLFVQLFDDGGAPGDSDGPTPPLELTGTIPASGELHFAVFAEGAGGGWFYTLNLAAPLPEPAGAALLGGSLLAAAALRRVRRRNAP